MKDFYFGRVVLLVCALGSRYSDDERVLVGEGKNGRQEGDTLTAGFAWFSQGLLLGCGDLGKLV
jgi:hypothetical protein